ncbi:hypothetical protein PAHAL_9G034500 [Panicum hallii]|uniref:Uncharacterized protein n=1 Tax=Panicum hallii TaxID=206008 RepID=A0A2S3IGR5_9POAL|nr:protein trichome birefringence-like 34 [Panicum hallii]PAN44324.1 hypothetical protein PAHAL_9G034500 [Panicum hallii]
MTVSVAQGRKARSTAAGAGCGGLEEAWLLVQAPATKQHHARAAVWGVTVGVGLRGRFYSLVLLVLVLLLVLTASVTTVDDNGEGGAKPQAATTTVPRSHGTGDGAGGVHHHAAGECDMSSGRWVYDGAAYPVYRESACRFMSDQTACEKFGRTDRRYQRWRWQPHGCDLPRFDAARLLLKLRDKRLAFVGDSLNRNQWVSMVCLIDTATPTLHKSMANNGSLVSFKIHEYNASVDFYWSPLLVESNSDHPVHHRVADRIVRAGSIAKHARRWADADVLVFNSYLWWRRPAIKVMWGSFEQAAAAEGDHGAAYEVADGLRAFELAIRTWSEWLELHVDRARTQLFFTSMSPTHLRSDEWEAGDDGASTNHQCYNETEPILAEGHRGRDTDPAFARAVEAEVARLAERGVAVRVLNVTQLSEHRKDAHPSVHRRQWSPPTAAELAARARDPSSGADCIHWCLPGVPDVWNQMLYAHIVAA